MMKHEAHHWVRPRSLTLAGLVLAAMIFAGASTSCRHGLEPADIPSPALTTGKSLGVCPPFPLRDEAGKMIDPVKGVNDTVPYSPRQTCGTSGCHDYQKITEGFHFTQGKGEALPEEFAARYNWVTSPGNYGGNWCSPAPLYRQLAPKTNASARLIDMTSFDFVTATCGNCHPGGGPLEYDRRGKRYDTWMSDPASALTPGGDNGLDGDYYKARWSETGVIEADCLLCHQPEYDLKTRNAELAGLNFKWAATAGAGFGAVKGRVAAGERPVVAYEKSKFDADGNIIVHMAPEPRNETCLGCHAKPDWKKRGASYTVRTDVHMAAGLRCVDCHAAGSRAADPRIRDREAHQFGKGDDPSGWVRNDLDNTVRTCETCHVDGWRNAPRATHAWLPPLHLEKIACQTCHIPARAVKSALVQASDIYNPAPRITPPAKHIWAFYDQEMTFWNHYGELELFTSKDEPTDITRPTLIRYKGKIYAGNRVHSAWVGFEEKGKPGLNQLFMKDFFQMWTQHRGDPKNKYPELGKITDDSKDGVIEVNRGEEIDALLASVKDYLATTGFPMAGRRLVWVSDDRAYYSAEESRELSHEAWEATPYASAYKYSHDIAPARAALGSAGCTDCHRNESPFFQGAVLDKPFTGDDARPRWISNSQLLDVSPVTVRLGAFREEWLKPVLYALIGILASLAALLALRWSLVKKGLLSARMASWATAILAAVCVVGGLIIALTPGLLEYMTVRRFTLDANHFWVACGVLSAALIVLLAKADGAAGFSRTERSMNRTGWALVGLAAISGALMILKIGRLEGVTRLAYTFFDFNLAASALVTVILLTLRLVPREEQKRSLAGIKDLGL